MAQIYSPPWTIGIVCVCAWVMIVVTIRVSIDCPSSMAIGCYRTLSCWLPQSNISWQAWSLSFIPRRSTSYKCSSVVIIIVFSTKIMGTNVHCKWKIVFQSNCHVFPVSNVVSKPMTFPNASAFYRCTQANPLSLIVWIKCPIKKNLWKCYCLVGMFGKTCKWESAGDFVLWRTAKLKSVSSMVYELSKNPFWPLLDYLACNGVATLCCSCQSSSHEAKSNQRLKLGIAHQWRNRFLGPSNELAFYSQFPRCRIQKIFQLLHVYLVDNIWPFRNY